MRALGRAADLHVQAVPRAALGEEARRHRAPSHVRCEDVGDGDVGDEVSGDDGEGVGIGGDARHGGAQGVRGVGILGRGDDLDVASALVPFLEPRVESRRRVIAARDEENILDPTSFERLERVPHDRVEAEIEHVTRSVLGDEVAEATLATARQDDALYRHGPRCGAGVRSHKP